uniref:Peptidase S1 domain-containing protein n=1 Tax=Anopheles minimus TaxID=112268 RepID=A0A182WEA6_9DIPT
MRGLILVAVFWTVSTKRLTPDGGVRVRSLQTHDLHVCNAVQIENGIFLTPAACLNARDLQDLEVIGKELKTHCNVTKVQSHPKYLFLSYNIAVLQVECDRSVGKAQTASFSDSKPGDRLTLAGVNRSLRVKTQACSVCQKEYAVFDCKRQICLKVAGKVAQTVAEGLAGAGIFTQNAKLVALLSYGFANGSLVAERVIYYKQFLHRTMQEFTSSKSNGPTCLQF